MLGLRVLPKTKPHTRGRSHLQLVQIFGKGEYKKKIFPTFYEVGCLFANEFTDLKLVSAIFYENFIFPLNDSPSKTMKNVFYFI